MLFESTDLQKNIDNLQKTETNDDVYDLNCFDMELDFVEQCKDVDGVVHIKTFFNHNDLDESDLWEVFDLADGSCSLEILLSENY